MSADGGIQRVAYAAVVESAGGNFPFYVNQYALGYKLLKGTKKVKADTIMTAFLFGLEHEMQVELFKKDKNDEIDTLELRIAAACEIHGEPRVPRQVVQKFYGYGGGVEAKPTTMGAVASGSASGGGSAYGFGCVALHRVGDFTFSWERAI